MATNKKFKFTGESKEVDGVTVHRIELLRDIQFTDGPNAGLPKFKAGRIGKVKIRGRTLSSGIYNPEKIRQERISERIRQARLDAAKKRREKAEQKGANKTKGNKLA